MQSLILGISGLVGLTVAYRTYTQISIQPDGNARMQEIALAIREGALTFLRREATYLIVFVGVVFFLLWGLLNFGTAISYIVGSACSLAAGFAGMKAATLANVRTAHAASENKPDSALMVAFNGGAVMGLSVASLGLLGLALLYWKFGVIGSSDAIVGFLSLIHI